MINLNNPGKELNVNKIHRANKRKKYTHTHTHTYIYIYIYIYILKKSYCMKIYFLKLISFLSLFLPLIYIYIYIYIYAPAYVCVCVKKKLEKVVRCVMVTTVENGLGDSSHPGRDCLDKL